MNYTENFANQLKKNLGSISCTSARTFLLKNGYAPSSFKMPEYYKPKGLNLIKLKKINWESKNSVKITTTLNILTPKGYLSWRSFNFLHPFIFWYIVTELTTKENWKVIKKLLRKKTLIHTYSTPVLKLKNKETVSGKSILNWLQMAEKDLIKDCTEFNNLTVTDIKNFYPSIYTHSIAWAIHGKENIRQGKNRYNKHLLGNKLDKLFQNSRNGQTNGIPVGSMVADIIAEIILSDIDAKLSDKIKEEGLVKKVQVSRYRDDYRILSKTTEQGKKVLQFLTRILNVEYDLHLNSDKTNTYTDIVEGSFRPWMLEVKNSNIIRGIYYDNSPNYIDSNYLKDCLLEVYRIQKKYPEGRASLVVLMKLVEGMHRDIKNVKLERNDVPEIISILRKLTLLREEATPQMFTLLDVLLSQIKTKREKRKILEDIKKAISGKDDQDYQVIWFYRLCLSRMPDMCTSVLKENKNPLLRVVSRKYYRSDYKIFDDVDFSISDTKEMKKFKLIDRERLCNSKSQFISPKITDPFQY